MEINSLKNQRGVSLVSVMVISGALIGSMFYLYDKVDKGLDSVQKYHDRNQQSLGLRGVMAYAKDLLESRSCVDSTKFTGLPEYPCRLTDAGSLERLLISQNVFNSLCNYYVNSGRPLDGLQNFCGSGKPPLPIDKFEFKIKKSKISDQHLIYSVFNDKSEFSLKGSCLAVTYESSLSSLHAASATITTRVKLYKDDDCSTEVIASGETADVYFPRQINEFALISNRSLSIGDSSKESDMNILDPGYRIIFHSPVFVNKNLYYPTSGVSGNVAIKFTDKILVAGDILSLDGKYPEPVYSGSGELWLSKNPHFSGFQKGIMRSPKEKSLQVLFDAALTPVNDASLMDKCNAYRNRKQSMDYCEKAGGAYRPIVVFKQVGTGLYDVGMTKLGEFISYDVIDSSDTSRNYSNESLPKSAQSVIKDKDIWLKILTDNHYISPNDDGFFLRIDLLREKIIEIKGASSIGVSCHGDFLNDGFEYCYNSGIKTEINGVEFDEFSLYKRTSANVAFETKKYKQDKNLALPIDNFSNGLLYRYVNLGCDSKDCEIEEKTYKTILEKLDVPYFKIRGKIKRTSQGNRASQVYQLELSTDPVDSTIFNYKILSSRFIFEPKDFCHSKKPYKDENFYLNYKTATISNGNSFWSKFDGTSVPLSREELEYLKADFTYHEICDQVPTPSTAYASYDADWSSESFNSWNFNPIDKAGGYSPNASRTGFDKIFNLADSSITNKLEINDTNDNLFHSYSILDRCIIKSSAKRVKGFLTCRLMYIEQRSSNLEMIGTFIVDKLIIDKIPKNYEITWKNIYHPAAREALVGHRQLLPQTSCGTTAANPVWARLSSKCDPSYLTEKAIPYTWTTFDPLCIVLTGNPVPLCKPEQRGYNFNIQRLYEHYGI